MYFSQQINLLLQTYYLDKMNVISNEVTISFPKQNSRNWLEPACDALDGVYFENFVREFYEALSL